MNIQEQNEALKKQVRKLASELNDCIGHPENPFPENILDELVQESYDLLKETRPPYKNWENL